MYETNNPLSAMSYTNLDFQTIYSELLETAKSLSKGWDPTISNESDPGVVLLKIAAIIGDKNNYNIDKNVLENFPDTYTQDVSARSQYRQLGYKMPWYRSATTTVSFKWNGDELTPGEYITIPKYTMVTDIDSRTVYTTLEDAVLGYADELSTTDTVKAIQGIYTEYSVMGDTVFYLSNLDSSNRLYLDNRYVAENGIYVTQVIDGQKVEWELVDNVETQPYGTRCFEFDVDIRTNLPYVRFPQSIDTLIGDGLSLAYISTSGESGNISASTLSQFYDKSGMYRGTIGGEQTSYTPNGEDILITNTSGTSNGADPEGVDEAARSFKKLVTTFDTLVTLRDYNNAVRSVDSVSNAIVTDRTNDIQCSYKIIDKDDNSALGYTLHRTGNTSLSFEECTWNDIKKNGVANVYRCSAENGGLTKIPLSENIDNLPKDGKYYLGISKFTEDMSAFDLKFYLLKSGGTLLTLSQYDDTFKIEDSDVSQQQIDTFLYDKKSVQHDYSKILPCYKNGAMKTSKSSNIFMLQNRYPIRMKIVPTQKLSEVQITSVASNVRAALIKELNSSNCEFGVEPSYDKIYSAILNSDDRIKVLMLDDFVYTTYAVYKYPYKDNGVEYEYKYVPVNNYQNDSSIFVADSFEELVKIKNDIMDSFEDYGDAVYDFSFIMNDNDNTMYKISRTPATDGFKYETYTSGQGENQVVTTDSGKWAFYKYSYIIRPIRNEIIAKNILAGVTPLLSVDESFSVPITTDIVPELSGKVESIGTELSVYPFGKDTVLPGDSTSSAKYTLRENENLRFYAPSFIDNKTFGNYVRYELNLGSPIVQDGLYEVYSPNESFSPNNFYVAVKEGDKVVYQPAQSNYAPPIERQYPMLRLDSHYVKSGSSYVSLADARENGTEYEALASVVTAGEFEGITPEFELGEYFECVVDGNTGLPTMSPLTSIPDDWGSGEYYKRNTHNYSLIPVQALDRASIPYSHHKNWYKASFTKFADGNTLDDVISRYFSLTSEDRLVRRYFVNISESDYSVSIFNKEEIESRLGTDAHWEYLWNASLGCDLNGVGGYENHALFAVKDAGMVTTPLNYIKRDECTSIESLASALDNLFRESISDEKKFSTYKSESKWWGSKTYPDGVTYYYPYVRLFAEMFGVLDEDTVTTTAVRMYKGAVIERSRISEPPFSEITTYREVEQAVNSKSLYYISGFKKYSGTPGNGNNVWVADDAAKFPILYDYYNFKLDGFEYLDESDEVVSKSLIPTNGVFTEVGTTQYPVYGVERNKCDYFGIPTPVVTKVFNVEKIEGNIPDNVTYYEVVGRVAPGVTVYDSQLLVTSGAVNFSGVVSYYRVGADVIPPYIPNKYCSVSVNEEESAVIYTPCIGKPENWEASFTSYNYLPQVVDGVQQGTQEYINWKDGKVTYFRAAQSYSIPANSEYQLRSGDYIIFFWREEDDDNAPYVYEKYGSKDSDGNPVIIKANFTLTTPSENPGKLNNVPDGTGTVHYNDVYFNVMKGMLGDEYTLSGTKSVSTRRMNSKKLTPSENRYYYVISTTKDEDDHYSMKLSMNESKSNDKQVVYSRLLDNEEFFIYMNNDKSGYEILSAGTLVEVVTSGGEGSTEYELRCKAIDPSIIAYDGKSAFEDYCQTIENGTNIVLTEQQIYSFVEGDEVQFTCNPASAPPTGARVKITDAGDTGLTIGNEMLYSELKAINDNLDGDKKRAKFSILPLTPISFSSSVGVPLTGYSVQYSTDNGVFTPLPEILVANGEYAWMGYAYLNLSISPGNPQSISTNKKDNKVYAEQVITIGGKSSNDPSLNIDDSVPLMLSADVVVDKVGAPLVDISYVTLGGTRSPVNLVTYRETKKIEECLHNMGYEVMGNGNWKVYLLENNLLSTKEVADGDTTKTQLELSQSYVYREELVLNSSIQYMLPIKIFGKNTRVIVYDGNSVCRCFGHDTPYCDCPDCSGGYSTIGGEGKHFFELKSRSDGKHTIKIYVYGLAKDGIELENLIGFVYNSDIENAYNGTTIKNVLTRMRLLDPGARFNYAYVVPDDVAILDPLLPSSLFNTNHIYNKFTIPKALLNITSSQKTSANTNSASMVVVNNR